MPGAPPSASTASPESSAADPTPLVFHGSWAGEITRAAAGEGGFGYDPIFLSRFCWSLASTPA
jgi:inosine/xanthosine triphosphate pyrophosphatase family protein